MTYRAFDLRAPGMVFLIPSLLHSKPTLEDLSSRTSITQRNLEDRPNFLMHPIQQPTGPRTSRI